MILYVDSLFLINFTLDFLCLYLAGLLLHLQRRIGFLLLASLSGAAYAVLAVLFSFSPVWTAILSPVVAFLSVRLCYGGNGWKTILLSFFAEYTFAILFSGCLELFFEWLDSFEWSSAGLYMPYSDMILLAGFLFCLAVRSVIRIRNRLAVARSAEVFFSLFGKESVFSALIDSGCLLRDPISGKPVILANLDAVRKVLPEEIVSCAVKADGSMPRNRKIAVRCRLIPVSSLGEKMMLLSVFPEKTVVKTDENKKECDVILALYPVTGRKFDGKEGLIPSILVD